MRPTLAGGGAGPTSSSAGLTNSLGAGQSSPLQMPAMCALVVDRGEEGNPDAIAAANWLNHRGFEAQKDALRLSAIVKGHARYNPATTTTAHSP